MKGVLYQFAQWNLVVPVIAVLLSISGFELLGLPWHLPALGVVGAGSFLVYTLDRRLPYSPEDGHPKRDWDPAALMALVTAPLVAAYACIRLAPAGRAVVGVLAVCSIAYILPVLPGRRRLKDIPFLKVILVSMGWAAATVILPATQGEGVRAGSMWLAFGYRTLFLAPNLLLADWPDRDADRAAGIRTAANQMSESLLLRQCAAAAVAAGLLATAGVVTGRLPAWILLELPALVLLLAVARPPLPTDRRFYLLFVDGLAGWPGIVALMAGSGIFG